MSCRGIRILLTLLMVVILGAGILGSRSPVRASHHREAPAITEDYQADVTDVYSFLSPDGSDVTAPTLPILISAPVLPQEFGLADTIYAFASDPIPGGGPQTIPFEIPHLRLVSAQPFTVSYGSGGTEQFDIVVTESAVSSTGVLSLSPSGPEGGTFSLTADIIYRFTFTSLTNAREVVVDMGTEGLAPYSISGSGPYSYACPSDYLVKPGVTADICLGHDAVTATVEGVQYVSTDGGLNWTQRPAPAATTTLIAPVAGFDPYTIVNGNLDLGQIPFSSDFFGTGSQLLSSSVTLSGTSGASPTFPSSHLLIERTAGVTIADGQSATTPLVLHSFRAESTVQVQNSDGSTDVWALYISESPSEQSTGDLSIFRSDALGGFSSQALDVSLNLEFVRASDGLRRVYDFVTNGFGPVQTQGSTNWSHFCSDRLHVYGLTTDYCPGTSASTGATFPMTIGDFQNFPNVLLDVQIERTPAQTATVNQPPVLDPIEDQQAQEGTTTALSFSATDPNGDSLSFSVQNAPPYSQFVDNGNGTATLTVTSPPGSSSDVFDVTVTVTDSGAPPLSDQETFSLGITPAPSENAPPVLDPIADVTVREFEVTILSPFAGATDADGDTLALSASGLPIACALIQTLSDAGVAAADLRCDVDVAPGIYAVTVTADDFHGGITTETFTLTVAPLLDTGGDQTVNQGDQITLSPSSSPGSTIDFDLDGDGVFETPGPTAIFDASGRAPGDYELFVRATKNGASATESLIVTVVASNSPPTIVVTGATTVTEGDSLSVVVTITDPESVPLTGVDATALTSGNPIPFTIIDFQDGTAIISFGYETLLGDAGEYSFEVTASDGVNPVSQTLVITIEEAANTAPVLTVPTDVTLDENETTTVQVSASDAEEDAVILTASGVPTFGSFVDNEDGSGSFTFAPLAGDSGTFLVTVTATDGRDPNLIDEDTFTVTVLDVNQGPVLDQIDDVIIDEGQSTTISISGNDPDAGDSLTLSVDGPGYTTLNDNGDGTGLLLIAPGFQDAGTVSVTVTLIDDGDPHLSDTETFTITVINVNQDPLLDPVDDVTVNEGESTFITYTSSDPDPLDTLTLTSDGPAYTSFVDNGDGTGTLTISPGFQDAGVGTVLVTVTDDGDPNRFDSDTLTITVLNVNQVPLLDPVDDLIIDEGETGSRAITGSDPDGDAVVLSLLSGPSFCALVDEGDGTGTVSCAPGDGDAGEYPITIVLSDDGDPPLGAETTWRLIVESVEGPGGETYDELEELTRALVDHAFAERLLIGVLNLAQYFDEELGLTGAAQVLLRSFIRLVQRFTPYFIQPDDAQQLIDFAESLLENLQD